MRNVRRDLEGVRTVRTGRPDLTAYRDDPVGYARDVLGVTPTPDQAAIAPALLHPPYRVMVKSGHKIGKTFLAAWVTNWWFDTRDPGVAISTAPRLQDVKDVLWTEVRLQRLRAGLPSPFIGDSAPEMRTGPDHWAKGYTARLGESFQGRHRPNMLFVFDEAEGVSASYWTTTQTMFKAGDGHAWLAILNPTTTTSQSYLEERAVDARTGDRLWRVYSVSSLGHPNIAAELRGGPPPVPNAVGLAQVYEWLSNWFEAVPADQADPGSDVEFPPDSGSWWRPGPIGEARVLGRRPSAGTYGVWSERRWEAACKTSLSWRPDVLPEIGCDVARFGDDWSAFHVRCGPCSLYHEEANGWDVVRVAARLRELAAEWAGWATAQRPKQAKPIDPKAITLRVDDTGVGGGVTDVLAAESFNVEPVNAGGKAARSDLYPRARDELWFHAAELARVGGMDLSRLGKKTLARLEAQALAPEWKPDSAGRRQVEPKQETKARIGRSPDGMDALNLAFYEPGGSEVPGWVGGADRPHRSWRERGRG